MWAWQFAKALHIAERHGWTRFVSMQNHYNLVYREEEREMMPLCRRRRDRGDSVEPAGPWVSGRQPAGSGQGGHQRARHRRLRPRLYYADSDFQIVDRVVTVANARGVAPAQIALAWLLRQTGVTAPIVGASKMAQLDQAVEALEITLTDDECRQLEELYEPHTVRW